MPRPGELRHRIVIQEKTEAQNAVGEPVYTWATKYDAWASISPASAREYPEGMIQAQDISYWVVIRYRQDITSELRIQFTDRHSVVHTYDIEKVLMEEEFLDTYISLACREQV